MSDFFTPKRSKKKGGNSDNGDNAGELSSHSNNAADGVDVETGEESTASGWKKLRDRVRGRRGSVLYRNSERGDHLNRLFLKRTIKDAIMNSLSVTEVFSKSARADLDLPQPSMSAEDQGFELAVPPAVMAMSMKQYDESYILELRAEVESEMDKETESAKIRQLKDITKDYQALEGYNEFPLEVRLENVSYTVPVDEDKLKIMTVYNASCLYPCAQTLKRLCKGERKRVKELGSKRILSDISLVLKPGRQYLVLGPPGSGKSTLLRSVAGLLHPKKKDEVMGGCISYNGRTLEESDEFYIKNAFAYIDQLDKHAPRLTVEETFEFAFQCSTGGKYVRETVPPAVEEVMKKADKDHLATRLALAGLGLTEVKDTYVGDAAIRGVSGGQRRRVTVGEMLMSRAPVLCGDEISTGLDAASTYDMIQVILYFGRVRQQTGIFSLLQPSPETVSLFDDVIVLAEGQIIYAGPIEEVEDYFANVGFRAPEFTDVADFLQMVSTEDGASLYVPDEAIKELRPTAPTVSELAEIFRKSELGVSILNELKSPPLYVWSKKEGSQHAQVSKLVMSDAVRKKYANRFPRSTQLIFWRFIVLWIRDKRVIIAGAVKNVLMGVSVGGVFFNTVDALSIQGALFQAGLFIMLGAMQGASALLQDRIIYYKHADANFYSSWPFVFGRTLSQMPQTIADTVTFASILYYMIGLGGRTDAKNFFIYLSILITFAILMNAQLALFASFGTGAQVQVYSSCTLLLMMLFGGFIIPPNAIPKYYSWVFWWNPFAWAYRALILNEFLNPFWGDQVLVDAGFKDPKGNVYGKVWVGYSFLYMVPYFLMCVVFSAIVLKYVRHTGNISPEPASKTASDDDKKVTEKVEIPFKPVTLSFQDVCYLVTASTTKEQLSLLKSVNGIFRPGQMCALMGSSGAGKTTLMDVIALRKRSGTITGEVRLNGWLQDPISFRRCSGYVEQFDVQSPELTVRETVLFSARLRLDPILVETDEEKQAFVDHILEEVELSDLTLALVGTDEEGGLSFEQKKRLSIAVELAASPSVIFLDEPTSGLDARSAKLVVKTLRKIADGQRTVCATIHQPSSAVFGMFDELLLLKKGGHVVYHGPLGDSCGTLVSYFESRGAPSISLGENPANWMLRVITAEEQKDLAEAYLQSEEFASLKTELDDVKESPAEDLKIVYESEFATSWARRRQLINQRLQLLYWRSPTYNLARVMVSLVIAFVLGSVFFFSRDIDVYSEIDMQARLAVVYIAFTITGIMAILSVLPVMTKIRDMYYRHSDAGMYDSYSMGLALGVAEKYFILLSTTLFCLVFLSTSALGKFNGIPGLIGFWGFFTFNFAIYSYLGQLFVCLVKPTATAIILCSIFIGLNNFFSGLIVRPQFMDSGFYAVPYYICPGHYVYESLVWAIFDNNDRKVMANVGSEFYDYLVMIDTCPSGSTDCIGTMQQYVNVFFGFQYSQDHQTRNALILGGVLVLARVLTWVALKYIRFAS